MKTFYNFSKRNLLKVITFMFLSILALMPTTAWAQSSYEVRRDSPNGTSLGTRSTLSDAVTLCSGGFNYFIVALTDDLTLSSPVTITGTITNRTITLTSGTNLSVTRTIMMTGTGRHLELNTNTPFTIENIILEGDGRTTGINGGIQVRPTGILNIKTGAVIRYCFSNASGGGIYNQGILNMTGGLISGNTALAEGGGIYSQGVAGTAPTAEISGGAISGNSGRMGGGIYSDNCNTTISGNATIGGDEPPSAHAAEYGNYGNASTYTGTGGGVGVSNSVTLTLTGNPEIKNNRAGMGGGGGISIGSGSNLEMSGGTISGNIAECSTASIDSRGGNGGGIHIVSRNTSTISGGTIENNEARGNNNNTGDGGGNGGGVFLDGEYTNIGTLNMVGGTIRGNKALGTKDVNGGGGVFVTSNAIFNMTGGVIQNNEAIDGGGGVRVNGVFEMTAPASITRNKSTGTTGTSGGGGVATTQSGALFTMNSGTISYNESATTGGGVRISSPAKMISGTISHNKAPTGGGGVTITSAEQAEFTMTGGVIEYNTGGKGGGVRNFRSFDMQGGVIQFNKATELGGGLYNSCLGAAATSGKPFKFVMSGGEISKDTAVVAGGGVYTHRMPSEMSGSATIKENVAVTGNGGGIYVYNILDNKYGYLQMAGSSQIINNKAPLGNGGGIFAIDFEYANTISNTTAAYWSIYGGAMIPSNVYGNESKLFHSPPTNASAFISRPLRPFDGTLLNNDQINFSSTPEPCEFPDWIRLQIAINEIVSGKIIHIYEKGNPTTEEFDTYGDYHLVLCEHPHWINSDGNPQSVIGKIVTIKSADPDDNMITLYTPADEEIPAGRRHITVGAGGELTIADLIIDGMENAGGIDVNGTGGILNIEEGAVIQNCHRTGSGGGVNMAANTTLNMNGGEIKYNIATGNGGGVNALGALIMSGGEISNNTATSGGGVYSTATIDMSGDATISYNNANSSTDGGGGGIYMASGSTLDMSGGAISNNITTGNGGGVNMVANCTLNMSDGEIRYNTASIGGGGILSTNGNVTILGNAKIHHNVANCSGSATAGGGGICINGVNSPELVISGNAEISHNTATNRGGGVAATHNSVTVRMSGNAKISYNTNTGTGYAVGSTTYGYGGGVFSGATHFYMSGSASIDNNTASRAGGGVFVNTNFNFYMNGGSITNNTANGYFDSNSDNGSGGGIYLANPDRLTGTGGTFSGNTAPKAYWLGTSETYLLISATYIRNNHTISYPWLRNPATFSNPPAGAPFVFAYNNFDVNWVGGEMIESRTITYHPNGGSGTMTGNPFTVTLDGSHTVQNNTFTRTGYCFTGWKDENGISYNPNDNIASITSHKDFYAQWVPVQVLASISKSETVCSEAFTHPIQVETGDASLTWVLESHSGLTNTAGITSGSGSSITGAFTNSGTTPLIATYKVTLTNTTFPNCQNVETVEITVNPKPVAPAIRKQGP